MKFENYPFSPELHTNLKDAGLKRPTDIQFKAIPAIMRGEDVLAIAQTGTGKTIAFALPIIHFLQEAKKKGNSKGIKCLIMVPTRELAIQIQTVFETLSKNTRINSFCLIGGVEQESQINDLKSGKEILITTPGRMFDLINQGFVNLVSAEILVLDEADKMLEAGFIKDIQDVKKQLPKQHQTLFFSATINKDIKKLAYSLVRNAIRIEISPKDPVSKNIEHSVAFIEMDDKRFFLEKLIKENPESRMLVFVRTKVRAERVFSAMERVGIKTLTLHGDKEQKERIKVLEQFRSGEVKVMIATDVSSRGIDIEGVDFVINYDLPEIAESYVHRIGRTGRGTKKGFAISFCSKEEKEFLLAIEEFTGKEIPVATVNKREYANTIFESEDITHDWKKLMREAEEAPVIKKKGKKGKK